MEFTLFFYKFKSNLNFLQLYLKFYEDAQDLGCFRGNDEMEVVEYSGEQERIMESYNFLM